MTLLLSFLFILSRVLHLLFCYPEFQIEDIVLGTLPKDLMEGLKVPFFDYAVTHYHGGTLIYGLLTVPSFLLFGKSVFSLRLTATLFQYGAFITWYLFMKRFFGKKPALYTALLYLFSPPWLTLFSMFANGSHTESLFFTALGLFFLYRLLYDPSHPKRDALFLGLISGVGCYFTYGVFVSVISFLLFWFYEDRKIFKKIEFFIFILFFLVGFSPWFVYNLLYQFHGLDLVRSGFGPPYRHRVFILPFRFLKLATLKLVGMFSFNYRNGTSSCHPHITFLNFLYYGVLLFSYLFIYRFEKKNKRIHFLFLFPLLYLLIASMSQFGIDTYFPAYLIPLFPFFFATLALGLTRLASLSRPIQKVSFSALLLLLVMGLKGELNLVSLKEFGLSLKYRGYSYRQLGWALVSRYNGHLAEASSLGKKLANGLFGYERFTFYSGLSSFVYPVKEPGDVEKHLRLVKEFDALYRPFFIREIGYAWGLSEGVLSDKVDSIMKVSDTMSQPYLILGLIESLHLTGMKPDRVSEYALRQMHKLSLTNQRALALALGKVSWRSSFEASFLDKIKRRDMLEHRLSSKLLPFYYQGVGGLMVVGYDPYWGKWPSSFGIALQKLPLSHQEALYWGAGFEAPLLYEDPFEYERMLQGIPKPFQKAFQQGLEDRLSWGGRNYWIEGRNR